VHATLYSRDVWKRTYSEVLASPVVDVDGWTPPGFGLGLSQDFVGYGKCVGAVEGYAAWGMGEVQR
jgi:hypothetical protein